MNGGSWVNHAELHLSTWYVLCAFAFSPSRRSTGGLHVWEAPNTKLLHLRRRCQQKERAEDTYSSSKMWVRVGFDPQIYLSLLLNFRVWPLCVIPSLSQSKHQNLLQQSSLQNPYFIRYGVYSSKTKIISSFCSIAWSNGDTIAALITAVLYQTFILWCMWKKEPDGCHLQCLYLYPQGVYYQTGDVIKVTDEEDGKPYYAQIRGFVQDQYCEKSAALTWLIPTQASPKDQFDPGTYIVGEQWGITICTIFRLFMWQVKNFLFCIRSRGGSTQEDGVPGVCVPRPLWIF